MSHFKGPDIHTALPNFQPDISVLKVFVEALRKNGDSIAMVEGDTGRSVSFAGLLQQSSRIAAGLRGAGVAAQDCVVLCCDKSILAMSFLLGIMFTGATAVIYPTTHAEQIHNLTKGHKVKAVIFDEIYENAITRVSIPLMDPSPSIIAGLNNVDQTLSNILNYSTDDFEVFDVSDVNTHIPLVLFSSGTTGEPKGIKISDIGLQLKAMSFQNATSVLSATPLFWLSTIALLSANIFQGFTWVMTNSREVKEILKLSQTYKVKVLYASKSFLFDCCQEQSLHTFNLSSVHTVYFGGDVVHIKILKTLSTRVFRGQTNLLSIYGTTETGGLTKCTNPSGLGHSGSPLPGVELKVVDDEGWPVPVGQVGHVTCRSPALTPGYWDNRTLALDHEGFLRLGDVGFMDNSGQLYLRGRTVDLIVHRGITVLPWEIEAVLMNHPGVANAVVVGGPGPHPSDGQRPVAFVVRRAGTDVTEDQLIKFVGGNVDDSKKLTGGVIFIDEIPISINSSKTQRHVLIERITRG